MSSAQRKGATYADLRAGFRWEIPATVNMGVLCCDRHPSESLALIAIGEGGSVTRHTFGELTRDSNRLANALAHGLKVAEGDRIGIVLSQRLETGLAHLAAYKLGAVAVPLSGLFGPEALRYRLSDCAARVLITDREHLELVGAVADELDATVICVDGGRAPHLGFWDLVADSSDSFVPAASGPDMPALLVYTSGTTGAAKGALHGHRVLHGHLPGFDLAHEFFGRADDLFWTPADWAWIGGLMDALMPSWFHGRPVVATRQAKFDPEWSLRLIAHLDIRNVFLPPTALKMMRQAQVANPGTRLRTIMSGGEPLGEEMLDWARTHLGVTINEIYGQTEANYLVGNCASVWEVRAGSMGRAYPGHDVEIRRADGESAQVGEVGQIALRVPDPVMFLGYWGKPEETRAKLTEDGEWLLTGDLASADEDGYLWYRSRNDDVISSGGYRIGPDEIESCLIRHPAVAMAAVVGVPDDIRGEAVKAFIVLADEHEASTQVEDEIRGLVKRDLAAYLYPRHVEFIPELPLTTTGKIRRADLRERELRRSETGASSPRSVQQGEAEIAAQASGEQV
jgi:acetyl-CoA synthetase